MSKKLHFPKLTKIRKLHLQKLQNYAYTTKSPSIHDFILITKTTTYLTLPQIEATRRLCSKHLKFYGYYKLNLFSNISLTRKSKGVRMGKGKGKHDSWVKAIRKGAIIFHLRITKNICQPILYNLLRKLQKKLPLQTTYLNNYF